MCIIQLGCPSALFRLLLSEMALHPTGQQNRLHQEVLHSKGAVACTATEEVLPHVASLAEEGKCLTLCPVSSSPDLVMFYIAHTLLLQVTSCRKNSVTLLKSRQMLSLVQ